MQAIRDAKQFECLLKLRIVLLVLPPEIPRHSDIIRGGQVRVN